MEHKCYILQYSKDLHFAIDKLVSAIPCFCRGLKVKDGKIIFDKKEGDFFEFDIICRQENLPFVQKILAPFV
jgi:hypothetical protein